MDDFSWQEQKSRKKKKNNVNNHYNDISVSADNRERNPLLRQDRNNFLNTHETIYITVKKKGDITILMKYLLDGDIEKQINEKLNILKCTYDGNICKLWDVLFTCLTKSSLDTKSFQDGNGLKNFFNKTNQNQKNYIDEDIICELCKYFQIQLKISSIDKNTKDIDYKDNLQRNSSSKVIHLLHVGFEYFIPLKNGSSNNKYKISVEETKLISELRILNKNTGVNQMNLEREKKLLNEIRKKLEGMEKQELYVPPVNTKGKKLFYPIYSPEMLDKRTDLIQCKLKFINAHSGKAIPVEQSADVKRKEIKLISRQNCGYNAFENDIVLVKINDPVNYTGKVMGVVDSNHKPVNSIYICKVSRDQGSLMSPLDKSFPKIHVDNQPGRRNYEKNRSKSLTEEQKSIVDLDKESSRYADNLCYSLFEITINKFSDKPIFKPKKVEHFNPETCDYFFIVCYEYWDPYFMYPNGKIVGTISSHESLKDNFHLISSICNIEPLEISSQYKREVENIKKKAKCVNVPGSYIPLQSVVFTIDDATTKDMDDAISYHKDGNDIIIGVHISDVTKYVSSTHEIYKQAETRFCTYYSPKFSKIPPVHILDESLATDVLSLVPKEPRAVVSVFFRFSENMISPEFKDFQLTDIIQPTFKEGIIVSQYKLTYDEVSSWLREKDIPLNANDNLLNALSHIYNIAKKIRRARLPESYFVHSVNECYTDMKIETNFEAHVLIEEFMLLANEYVARKIYEVYPDFSLLRMQNAVENFGEWKENLFKQTNMNFAGQLKEYCSLLNIRVSNFETKKKLLVSKKFLDKFNELLKYDAEKARNLLQYDTYYNDFYVHITEWYEINHPARYECSIEGCINNGHFSLNKSLYTHFTSPIRRFVDIVVHRLLKSVIKGIRIDDDVTLDIHRICSIANKKLKGNKTFEKICAPYAIFEETEKMFCFILDCACSEINNEELRFAHPLLQKSSSKKEINFADLSLDSVPLSLKINEQVESCTLKWKKIIFSCPPIDYSNSSSNKFVIDNNVFDAYLLDSSYKLFQEIRRSYLPTEKLVGKLNELKSAFIIPKYENVISSDSISISNPIIDIELKIFIKNTLRIQFCKYKVNGLPKISPELYIVAPKFQICLIHYDDPVRFFISGGKLKLKHNDIKKVFDSIREYQEYFEPLILIESLEETLADSSAFTLLGVPILWVVGPSPVSNCKDRYGVIILPQEFCKIRNIIFNDEKEEIIDRYEYLIEKGFSSVGGDLLCLRYKLESWKNYWVGHGEVVYVGKYKNDENYICKVIIFRLTQSDYDSFSNNSENGKYTIDVYLKSIVSKRQQEAISSINNHPLLKEVILGRQELSAENNDDFINSLKNDIQNKNLFRFNKNQTKAMFNAMNQKLSLIWGPPGTGKTHIGCILSYGFTQKNHNKKNGGVVLYCGPSNDCVNLVASEMQKKFSDICPKLLRIFGEQQELADFPLPGVKSKNNVKLIGEISEISLHYLIRKSGAKYADALRKYDDHFEKINNQERHYNNSDNNLEKLHSTIMGYRETVKDAKKQWIKDNRYDMVLCTTSVTASSVMELFNITQVIIDEAGMCKEPETLIPISRVEETVQNVVLIGDHKQLRPIIHSKVANKRGLQISLFERYQELKPGLVTMLNFQYRMHPSICEFPSKEFYSGRLKTHISNLWAGLSQEEMKFGQPYYQWNGIDYKRYCKGYYRSILKQSNYDAIPNEQWPGVRYERFKCFQAEFEWYPERIIFFHVVGDEIIQSVTTSIGNENSRGNNQEVEAVGCIYRKLIKRLHPPRQAPNFVTVLTQYKLQQHLIQLKCQEILRSENIRRVAPQVKTVIRSQGSENDYIIFSTVRSLRNKEDINENPTPGWEKQYLGFITDPNQVNVALTRAKKGLIIIGNKELLRVNKIWKRLIIDLERRNCVMENYLDFLP